MGRRPLCRGLRRNATFLCPGADLPFSAKAPSVRCMGEFRGGNNGGAANEVQVSHLLDEHGLGAFQIKLLIWSVLIAFIDGYDIGAVAFAAPHLIRDWHIEPKSLGLVLTASNFGVLFGSQIFGWVGDRYGRKTSLIICNILFGVFTYWAAYSTNLTELFWLRTIAGLGIGGVIPNIVAINAESAPRNLRATLAIIAAGMVPLGGALAGFAALAFIPQYGWPVLFYIGGVVPIVFAIIAIFGMPEFDQIHDAARKSAIQDGSADRGHSPRFQGAARCALRHRG